MKKNWKPIAACAYVFTFFFVVWIKVNVVRSGYRLRELEEGLKQAGLALADLENRWGNTASLDKVAAQAARRGFSMAGAYSLDKIRHVDSKGAVTALPADLKNKSK